MKLLVSDFDGTIEINSLFRDCYIPKGTISNINSFIKSGNKFMIATSRPYDSIMEEIKKYGIPYDYISVLNGCIVYDNNGHIIYSKDISHLDIDKLCELYSCISSIESIKNEDKILYYIFKIALLSNSDSLFRFLEKSDFSIQSWFLNTYNIVHPISNKVDSIRFIQELHGISDNDVITIGDSYDDLEMIKNYHSYGIFKIFPNIEVLKNCDKKVKSLNHSFKHINKNI